MKGNAPYTGMKKTDLKKLLKQSEVVSSFGGNSYFEMHQSTIKEIQEQKDRNAKAAQKSMHMVIHSGYTPSMELQSDVQTLIDEICTTAKNSVSTTPENPVDDTLIHNLGELAVSCVTTESFTEPKAEKILVRGVSAQTRKLYNIRFNFKGMISLLFDWVLLGDISECMMLQLVVMMCRTLAHLYDLSLIQFDRIHALILIEWYRMPKKNGAVAEEDLMQRLLDKYQSEIPTLDAATIRQAVDEMVTFHCADLENGNLIVTESLVIKS